MTSNASDSSPQFAARFGAAEEIHIGTRRADGTLCSFVPIWVVAVDSALYIRSYRGAGGAWYRHATAGSQRAGAIRAGGQQADVTFARVDPHDSALAARISQAYRDKYSRYGDSYLQPMLAEQAVAATVRLDPRPDE